MRCDEGGDPDTVAVAPSWHSYSAVMHSIRRPAPSSPIPAAFVVRLQQLRASHSAQIGLPRPLGQAGFASLLGIDGNRYGHYERGTRQPPLEVLARLREVTGVSLNDLIGGPSAKRNLNPARSRSTTASAHISGDYSVTPPKSLKRKHSGTAPVGR